MSHLPKLSFLCFLKLQVSFKEQSESLMLCRLHFQWPEGVELLHFEWEWELACLL